MTPTPQDVQAKLDAAVALIAQARAEAGQLVTPRLTASFTTKGA